MSRRTASRMSADVSRSTSRCSHDSRVRPARLSDGSELDQRTVGAGDVEDRVHDEVDAEVVAVDRHRDRVDEERHVVVDDVDHRVRCVPAFGRNRGRVDTHDRAAGRSVRAELPVGKRRVRQVIGIGTGEVVDRTTGVVGLDEGLDVVGADARRARRRVGRPPREVLSRDSRSDGTVGPYRLASGPCFKRTSDGPYAPPWTSPRTWTSRSSSRMLADAITMARFRATDLVVTTKPDLTPVSEADQAVEQAIRERLAERHRARRARRGVRLPIRARPADAEFRWIIDPIDGTKSYVRGPPDLGHAHRPRARGRARARGRLGARVARALVGRPRSGRVPRRRADLGIGDLGARRRADLVLLGHARTLRRRRHRREDARARAPLLALPRRRRLLAVRARRRRRRRHRDGSDREPLGRRRARADHRGSRRPVEHDRRPQRRERRRLRVHERSAPRHGARRRSRRLRRSERMARRTSPSGSTSARRR